MKSAKICALIIIAVIFNVLRASATDPIKSDRFSLYYIPTRTMVAIDSFLTDNSPPDVRSVKLTPENPGVNDDVMIEAEIVNDSTYTSNRPLMANLYYSTDDGAEWKKIDMEQGTDNQDVWRAVISALGKPCKVRYFITAKDDGGNYLIELPAVSVEWGGVQPPRLTGVITEEKKDPRIVFDDLDIRQAQVGYDGDLLYFAMKVEGNISGGTVSPFNVFVYSVGVYYPDSVKGGTIRTDFVLEHAQHAQFLLFPIVGLLDTKENLAEVRAADARYYSNGGWLYMRFKQDALKDNKFDKLRIIFGTAYATLVDPLTLTPNDATGFINISHVERSFEVK